MKPGSRIKISSKSKSLVAPIGATGYIDHEVDSLYRVYNETAWYVRLDDRSAHIQWESELEEIV